MERTAVFLDVANLECGFREFQQRIDYLGLRDYLAEGRFLVETFAYVPVSPYQPDKKKDFIDFLQRNGFLVRAKLGKPRTENRWKCNFDVELAVDMLHFAHHGRVDIIVIGSGDGDLIPVLQEIRLSGIRCEVASTLKTVSQDLLAAASGFIDLGKVIREQAGLGRLGGKLRQSLQKHTQMIEVL
jgi:uncharacterized LabA/DUF88 family protein